MEQLDQQLPGSFMDCGGHASEMLPVFRRQYAHIDRGARFGNTHDRGNRRGSALHSSLKKSSFLFQGKTRMYRSHDDPVFQNHAADSAFHK
ncbi:hypothetical protein SDC9_194387 [bioreactor metagenome]|uniref:Uncharacterized protein n=1 Tax=bioreactor metagenome TaxID=1076179 RepID=A0A645I6B5_9ZZZZ